jgi:hypothetical protein
MQPLLAKWARHTVSSVGIHGVTLSGSSSRNLEIAKTLLKVCDLAVPQLRRVVAGFPPRRPWFESGSGHVGFAMDQGHWSTFYLSTSDSHDNHCTDCSTFIIIVVVVGGG